MTIRTFQFGISKEKKFLSSQENKNHTSCSKQMVLNTWDWLHRNWKAELAQELTTARRGPSLGAFHLFSAPALLSVELGQEGTAPEILGQPGEGPTRFGDPPYCLREGIHRCDCSDL